MFVVKEGTLYSDGHLDLLVKWLYKGDGEHGNIPFYGCVLFLAGTDIRVGSIVLRIGDMMASKAFYYDCHIGYRINEEYRGRGFALRACKLISNLAKLHDMTELYITCNDQNSASIKVIEKLDAKFLETILIPKEYLDEHDQSNKRNRYIWKLD
ncbi:GNAT family N-acetyltransferase [Neobacillus sp. PS3-34]|uniref:GNAT family N-acetyltransferase n=1 Tax=Neobacillus sp. PS3-34 TaxID=3070678 RepID=UPI0027E0B1B1|nr:GNAT family N-acetyltransferase [Neobacillus sp. PS3-34]WML46619.1 GNAT family N-acetyltransferase [Neobacillus sp. PS3-34]